MVKTIVLHWKRGGGEGGGGVGEGGWGGWGEEWEREERCLDYNLTIREREREGGAGGPGARPQRPGSRRTGKIVLLKESVRSPGLPIIEVRLEGCIGHPRLSIIRKRRGYGLCGDGAG